MHSLTHGYSFAQRCSPYVVSAFIYIWHPDSRDTFNNYLSSPNSSVLRFENRRDKESKTWKTSITLCHWRTASHAFPEELTDIFSEEKESGSIPPTESVKDGSSKRPGSKEGTPHDKESLKHVEERSSSVVMSGDHRGDFWTCTVLSLSINEYDMDSNSDYARRIMHLFIHRPSSGTLLCFLLILGRMCWNQSIEYEDIILHMQSIIELLASVTVPFTVRLN
jgi:hypothetical protein